MGITDGAIMFAACVISFALGYIIGVIRVGRYVNKRLDDIKGNMLQIEKHSRELQQYFSHLEEKQ
jgi:hypothetical protein